jgi:hypothetical protein
MGDSLRSQSRVQRELIVIAISLLLGLLLIPAAIWLTGQTVLGPYQGGATLGALLRNYFTALGNGAPSFWFVALGPYVLILLARLLFAMLWGGAPAARAQTPPQPKRVPPQQAGRAAPAPEARRAPPPQPRRAPPAQNVRKTPYIKSID